MYPIDFMNCTADDVITRSVTCHPTLFCEELRRVARIHCQAMNTLLDCEARRVADKMATDCLLLSNRLEDSGTIGELTFGQRIIAFSAAARLQCVTNQLAHSIISRG